MYENILLTDTGMYVNAELECLKEYDGNIYVVTLNANSKSEGANITTLDISNEIYGFDGVIGDSDGYDSWQYHCINAAKDKLLEMLSIRYDDKTVWYRDVIVLGDLNNVESLYILKTLQMTEYNGNIHLILPLPFERTIKSSVQYELLSNLDKVRSLAVYDPYKMALIASGNTNPENVERVISDTTKKLLGRYNDLFRKMRYMPESAKYFFDFEKNSFVDTDSLFVLDDYVITHTLGLMIDPYLIDKNKLENDYFIECLHTPVPRPDGKRVCEILRSIRKEFAEANVIGYQFRECTYDGPCAGTCEACDQEANDLREIAKNLVNVIYPSIKLEEI